MFGHRTAVVGGLAALLTAGILPAIPGSEPAVAESAPAHPGPVLADPAPCEAEPDFTCSTLRVPLDHTGGVDGTLDLTVATAGNTDAPRGVLVLLTGGPGQPGVGLLTRIKRYFDPEVLEQYRLVAIDQRGTGQQAIDCVALQETTGGSDFFTPPLDAVDDCAATLGETRHFYSTPDTVADLELLRQALGVPRLTLDGISYGTFTAEQYALAYPAHVRSVVLDSVVPQDGFDPLLAESMHHTGDVLRDACADDPDCTTDPAADLAWVLRHGRIDGEPVDGTRLMESLAIKGINGFDPGFRGIPELLHAARQGDPSDLATFINTWSSIGTPADQLSAGLHIATMCSDRDFPWGDSATPRPIRQPLLEATLATMPDHAFWPYTKQTARSLLTIAGCARWPETRPAPYPARDVIVNRGLVMSGEHDLFTLTSWGKRQAAAMPHGRLVTFEGLGHGLQATDPGRAAVREFLLS